VPELLQRHAALVRNFHDAPALVLAGAGDLKPHGTRIIPVGRIDEESKWDALSAAMAVVVPSRFESLSLVTIEAFAVGTPVIGNAASEVVKGQLERSHGGVSFALDDDDSFRDAVQRVGAERAQFARAARKYAARYDWDAVVKAYLEEIDT
jgi:glycosyltransferase involved in cell wall biosynthesis